MSSYDIPAPTLDTEAVSRLFLGEHLGSGVSRHVYTYRPQPKKFVVKVEYADCDFQNVAEWELWCNAKASLKKWLAPCWDISPCGKALLQERAEPCPTHLLPKRVPAVLGDLHKANFGIIEGRVVLMDYGRHLALHLAANVKAMKELTV